MKRLHIQPDLRIALLYALFGGLWILLSDKLLALVVKDIPTITAISIYKGWLYVAISAALIYALLRRETREREITKNELAKNEETYRYLFADHPHPMWIYDLQTLAFLEINQAAVAKYGYSRNEFLKMTIKDIRPPEELPRLTENLAQPRLELEYSEGWRHRLKDGTLIDVSITSHTIKFNGREAALVVAQDITERKRAEKLLVQSEERYRTTLNDMMEGCQIIDYDWRYIYINDTAAKLGRTTPSELLMRTMMDVYPGIENTDLFHTLQHCMEERSTRRIETKFFFADGTFGWFELSIQPVPEGLFILSIEITERRQAEEALAASQKLLQGITDNSTSLIYALDPDGRFVLINRSLESVFGVPREAMLGKPREAILPPEIAAAHRNNDMKVITDGRPITFEEENEEPDGHKTYLSVKFPLLDSSGNIYGIGGISTDITERRQVQEVLRHSEENLRKAQHFARIGNWTWNIKTNHLEWSDEMYQIFGVDKQTFSGALPDVIAQTIHPDDRDKVEQSNRAVINEGRATPLEYRVVWNDGSVHVVWAEAGEMTLDETGSPFLLSGTVQDITERRQAEDALKQNETRLRLITDNMMDVIAMTDSQGAYQYVSPSIKTVLGYEPSDIVGKTIFDYVHPDDLRRMMRISMRALQGSHAASMEVRFRHADGHYIYLEATGGLVKDDEGRILGAALSARDISERKQAEEKIRRLNRLYATLSQINQTIVRVREPEALFEGICRVAVEHGKFRMAWIGLTDRTDGKIRPVHFAGDERGYLSKIEISYLDEDSGRGPTGTAFRGEVSIICQDIATDPRMEPWREQALQRGYRSSAAVPFRRAGRVIGVLTVYSAETQYFDTDDERLLDEIGSDISFALDSINAETQRKQVESRLQESERFTRSTLNALTAGIAVLDETGNIVAVNRSWLDFAQANGGAPGRTGVGMNYLSVCDAALAPNNEQSAEMAAGIRAVMRAEQDTFTLEYPCHSPTEQRWFQTRVTRFEDDGPLRIVITHVNITERKQTEQQIAGQLQHLKALHTVDTSLTSNFDLRVVLDTVLKQLVEQLRVDAASVSVFDKYRLSLEQIASVGFNFSAAHGAPLTLGQSLAGSAVTERRLIHIRDLSQAGNDFANATRFRDEKFITYYAVPLISKGQVKGVIELFHRSWFEADPDWLEFLDAMREQTAIAIDNFRLFDDLQRSNMELTLAYDATIEGWSRALDLRDKETEDHTLRVTDITLRLADKMGIRDEDQVQIKRGALLHDIGKLGVPDNILLKPGKLTEEEWVIMRQHPALAQKMLAPIRYLKSALDIPYCHHEKWDGTGYPRGLKGEQIPIAARMFAVVDVWDALRSDRPYRAAWPEAQVLDYIREQSGKHFDPQIVVVFLDMITNS